MTVSPNSIPYKYTVVYEKWDTITSKGAKEARWVGKVDWDNTLTSAIIWHGIGVELTQNFLPKNLGVKYYYKSYFNNNLIFTHVNC